MTKEQLKHTRPIDLHVALRLAFDAGCNYGISSHKDFVQIHEPCERVVEALARGCAGHNDEFRGGCKPSSGTSCCAVHSTEKGA